MDTYVSSDIVITAHILPCPLYIGINVKQYIYQGIVQSLKFIPTTPQE